MPRRSARVEHWPLYTRGMFLSLAWRSPRAPAPSSSMPAFPGAPPDRGAARDPPAARGRTARPARRAPPRPAHRSKHAPPARVPYLVPLMLTPPTTETFAAGAAHPEAAAAPRSPPPPAGRARPARRARLQLPLVVDARRDGALRRHRPDPLGPVPRQPG